MSDSININQVNKTIRVAFLPEAKDNPYLTSIASGLEKHGCVVSQVSGGTTFLLHSSDARKADVIHIHWPDPYLQASTWFKFSLKSMAFCMQLVLCRLLGKRIIWTAHNLTSHEAVYPRTQHFVLGRIINLCHAVLSHSHAGAEILVKHFGIKNPQKIRVVPHAHYIADYPQGISRKEAREHFGIGANDFVFLFVGSIRGYKGVQELIVEFGKIDDQKVNLIVAGKPRTDIIDREIEQLSKNVANVIYHGTFVPDDKLQVYMSASDAVVLPYRKILTSGTLILAASFAKVAIVPDLPSLVDEMDSVGLFCFDPQRENSLLSAMKQALTERSSLENRGFAMQHSISHWGWNEMSTAIFEIYIE